MHIVILFLIIFPCIVLSQQRPLFNNLRKLYLPENTSGPESIAFDSFGGGPYTGISDGRIVRYSKSASQFLTFAVAPNRSNALCNGNKNEGLGGICGRPLGIEFYKVKNELFIADAFRGLFRVGQNGGFGTLIASSAESIPFKFLNGLTVDQLTGDVYFTEFSSVFSFRADEAVATNDSTGRLLKYDYKTKKVTVLQRGLFGANGVALSLDRTYLLVAEFIAKRIRRVWLRGIRASQSEIVATFQGMPDNIKRTSLGDFWVALNIPKSVGSLQVTIPTAIKINGNGRVLKTLYLDEYYDTTTISEFNERGSKFYVGSIDSNYVGVLERV